MNVLYFKALHLVFAVTWFSGMFYLCRLYVYHREALGKPDPERQILCQQLQLMSRRLLFGITWPSAVLVMFFGLLTWSAYASTPGWLKAKLVMAILLFVYHLSLDRLYRLQKAGKVTWSGTQLRLWNEVPSVFLLAMVFVAVIKDALSWVYGVVALLGIMAILLVGIYVYRRYRQSKNG